MEYPLRELGKGVTGIFGGWGRERGSDAEIAEHPAPDSRQGHASLYSCVWIRNGSLSSSGHSPMLGA